MSDFLELLAADVADSSAPGIAATNRVRTVLFECLFNHLADERVESLFTILGFEHDFDCYAIAGYPARSAARTAKEIEKIVADFGGVCLTAKRPIGNSTAVVALIRPVGAATPEIICNTIDPSFAADRPIALGPQRTGADGAMRSIQATLYCLQAAPALAATVQPSPRPLRTDDALPERALIGDADARDELVRVVYGSLTAAGPDDPAHRLHIPEVRRFARDHGQGAQRTSQYDPLPFEARRRIHRLGCHRPARGVRADHRHRAGSCGRSAADRSVVGQKHNQQNRSRQRP